MMNAFRTDELFADDIFLILTKDKDAKEKVQEQIEVCGGAVVRALSKRVTMVVCDNPKDFEEDIKKVEAQKLPVVGVSFIDQSITNKCLEKPENHKPGASDSGPAAKKQKTDDSATGLSKGSEWMGVSVSSDKSTYPFVLEIVEVDGNNFNGGIKWPTLGTGAVTKVKGTIKGDQVSFEEYEAVVGEDDVEIPMYYTGKLAGDKLNGKLKDSTGEESTFNLSRIKTSSGTPSITTIPSIPQKDLKKYKDLPSFTAKSEWKGTLTLDYALTLKLDSLTSEGKVEGTIDWPIANAQTMFVGELKDSDFAFEETKILKGDGIDIPVKYIGKVDDSGKALSGTYEAPSSKGAFSLLEVAK